MNLVFWDKQVGPSDEAENTDQPYCLDHLGQPNDAEDFETTDVALTTICCCENGSGDNLHQRCKNNTDVQVVPNAIF